MTALTLAHRARDHHAVTVRQAAGAFAITAAVLFAVRPVALIVAAFAVTDLFRKDRAASVEAARAAGRRIAAGVIFT